jgi:hypothetical protein
MRYFGPSRKKGTGAGQRYTMSHGKNFVARQQPNPMAMPASGASFAAARRFIHECPFLIRAAAHLLELEPNFHISGWSEGRWQTQMYIDGLRKAGLPE